MRRLRPANPLNNAVVEVQNPGLGQGENLQDEWEEEEEMWPNQHDEELSEASEDSNLANLPTCESDLALDALIDTELIEEELAAD